MLTAIQGVGLAIVFTVLLLMIRAIARTAQNPNENIATYMERLESNQWGDKNRVSR